MATNKKHKDSNKYQKALTLHDRETLDKIISTHRNKDGSSSILLNTIGDMLEKDPTTLSKELKNRRTPINMSAPAHTYIWEICRYCEKLQKCIHKEENKDVKGECPYFIKRICKNLKRFPWVCNGCQKRAFCGSMKSYYNPSPAEDSYKTGIREAHEGVYMSVTEFQHINDVLSAGLKKRQSVEHILHSNDLGICVSTAYNYLHMGYINADVTDTHRMAYFRDLGGGRPHNSVVLVKKKVGRHYEDFVKLLADHPGMIYTEMDTVEGVKGGKVILSLKIVNVQLQLYFLLENKTAACVVNALNSIQKTIGIDNYKKLFGVILTDNGTEFTDIDGIMYDPETGEQRTDLYFCHPQCSGEKGSCERNHELLRYIVPKGKSFDGYTQDDLNLVASHVNSLKRKSTDFSTPLELFRTFFGCEILELFHITLIDPNSVILSPELLKK